MGTFSKAILYGSVTYFGLVLLKDGTIPTLIGDLARGGQDLAKGLRPITRVG